MIRTKNKIGYKIFAFVFLISFLFGNTSKVFSADLNLSPYSATTKVGDIIGLKVIVNSQDPINAVSVKVSFPVNVLSFSHFTQKGSIINLWAQDPVFSNQEGTLSFEGVILNGYSGTGGFLLGINFRAKNEGVANLNFISASVLANDGLGTEKLTGTAPAVIRIEKALVKTEEKETIIETSKEIVEKIKEVENAQDLPDYSLVILFALIIILILILILFYGVHYLLKLKRKINKKLHQTEKQVSLDFKSLEKEIEDNFKVMPKNKNQENLGTEEESSFKNLETKIEESEERIIDELKDIEKES